MHDGSHCKGFNTGNVKKTQHLVCHWQVTKYMILQQIAVVTYGRSSCFALFIDLFRLTTVHDMRNSEALLRHRILGKFIGVSQYIATASFQFRYTSS